MPLIGWFRGTAFTDLLTLASQSEFISHWLCMINAVIYLDKETFKNTACVWLCEQEKGPFWTVHLAAKQQRQCRNLLAIVWIYKGKNRTTLVVHLQDAVNLIILFLFLLNVVPFIILIMCLYRYKVSHYTVLCVWETHFSLCITTNCDMYKILIIKISKFKIKGKLRTILDFLCYLQVALCF